MSETGPTERVAWCVVCDGPVIVDDAGCVECQKRAPRKSASKREKA
jgi:hypothetical protein